MEDTILVGDFVLVNKFIFGSESPKYIPFTQIEIPHFRLPAIREPRRKDIVVFEFPGMRDQIFADERGVNYVKRCIGLPGDTIQVINKVVYVNHKQFWIPTNVKYLEPIARPKDMVEPRIFPKGMPWNEDNYGPIIVPKKGYNIPLDVNNVEQWETLINRAYGEKVVDVQNGVVTIKGKPVTSYTFDQNYYFMMGDNRDDSLDSRFWGFVPRSLVVGEAFITLFSWDRDIPFTDLFRLLGSIRPDRVLLLLN
jgi:signal peptidase I